MHTQLEKITAYIQPIEGHPTIKKIDLEFPLDFDNWKEPPKSKFQILFEHSTSDSRPSLSELENHSFPDDIEEAANEIISLIITRYTRFRRTLSSDNKIKTDENLIAYILAFTSKEKEPSDETKTFLKKEKRAAFQHIKNAVPGVIIAVKQYQSFALTHNQDKAQSMGKSILLAALVELYSGDQRFFKEKIKTRSEVATEGGIARRELYLAAKEKACNLLNELTPQEGWTQEVDAVKAMLPVFEKHLRDNKIKYPVLSNIKKLLRDWIMKDPLVSAAVRINKQPLTNRGVS